MFWVTADLSSSLVSFKRCSWSHWIFEALMTHWVLHWSSMICKGILWKKTRTPLKIQILWQIVDSLALLMLRHSWESTGLKPFSCTSSSINPFGLLDSEINFISFHQEWSNWVFWSCSSYCWTLHCCYFTYRHGVSWGHHVIWKTEWTL